MDLGMWLVGFVIDDAETTVKLDGVWDMWFLIARSVQAMTARVASSAKGPQK